MTRQRVMIIILVVSLGINLLFIGALVGRWAMHRNSPPFPPHFGWMMRGVDEQTRQDLRPVIREQAMQLVPLRREMQDAQRRFNQALTSEPLDEAALHTALQDLREPTLAFQAPLQPQTFPALKRLPPAARAQLPPPLKPP
ncbi:MAG: periplasmic heavy metal sensor, partial [Pseudomonadales bacterium]|nr:periplasmic heavy metal sensor [Pseudomonadales bacterium]